MGKTMVRLQGNKVVNFIWCNDFQPETDILKDIDDHDVQLGDTFSNGEWYRNGDALLTPLETAVRENVQLKAEKAELEESYRNGVNSI